MDLIWQETDDYLCASTHGKKCKEQKLITYACFDLDYTLIKTLSGHKFPKDENDWTFLYGDTIISKIRELYDNDIQIVIITNQGGLESGQNAKVKKDAWKTKINNIVSQLNVNIKILCAISGGRYRKPKMGFLEFLPKMNMSHSFYCGDFAGRPDDYDNTDYKFALNCGIQFYTPEMMFLNKTEKLHQIEYPIDFNDKVETQINMSDFESASNEMIIMVGVQGSGKSTVAKTISKLHNYIVVNQDTCKTKIKCVKLSEKIMTEKDKSLIIDMTNPSKNTRSEWIDLATKYNYTVRIIEMTTSEDIAMHNNNYRNYVEDVPHVSSIAYKIYNKNYEKPDMTENIMDIIQLKCGKPCDNMYYKYYY